MVDEWYFAWGEHEFGPYSADQLRALAASGRLQPADVVWAAGTTARVSAIRVKNLFRPAIGAPRDTEVQAAQVAGSTPVEEVAPPEAPTAPPPVQDPPARPAPAVVHKKKGRATAGPGVVIVSQDGERAQYKKKCVTCGFEDTARHSLAIRNGVTRAPFFCPKCRKTHSLEIHCTLIH